jgi:putative ABC transport system permease protein
MPQLMQDTIAIRRFLFIVLAFFGGSAVVLSGLGLYSLISFLATSRVREVGIRVALGSTRVGISLLIVSQGLRLTLMGVAAGTLASLVLHRLLSGLLFGIRPFDLSTILVAAVILAATTCIAALIPAWRIARMNPMKALRTE